MPERAILENLSPIWAAILALLPPALLARLLWHWRQVTLGRRRFWSWALLWELPTAVLCAIAAGGITEYLNLAPLGTQAVAGAAGWLGPRGLEVLLSRLLERYTPKKKEQT